MPDDRELYRQLGELVAEAREAREARQRNSIKLDEISRRQHELANKLDPLVTQVESHAEKIGELEDERLARQVSSAKRAGLVAGYGLAAGTGGAFLQKLLDWIGTFR